MTGYEYRFSVFTPTYNRAHTLPRVYESLQAQTYREFEWLIVDDGSTDNTKAVVETWQRDASFPIRYFWQPNGGKHVALNRGVREARGELFLTLDSDDACVPHALERFLYHWDSIPSPQKHQFSAVTALCMDQRKQLVGTPFPYHVTDSDSLEIQYRHKVRGEKWGFHRTDVLRQYPFPDQFKFYVPEGIVWKRIARRYKTRFVNEILRIYYDDQPSLMRGQKFEQGACGGRLEHLTVLNDEIDYFRYSPVDFYRSAVHYVRFSCHRGVGIRQQIVDVRSTPGRLLFTAALPVGFGVHARDRWRFRRRSSPPA